MDFHEMLNNVLYLILTAIMPIITAYAVNLIKSKIQESTIIKEATQNEAVSKLIKAALSDVMDAVLYVNQVYADSLKASGKFDEAAQKEAFARTYEKAAAMISQETKEMIENAYGSFDKWLQLKIEASVNAAKKQS